MNLVSRSIFKYLDRPYEYIYPGPGLIALQFLLQRELGYVNHSFENTPNASTRTGRARRRRESGRRSCRFLGSSEIIESSGLL